MEMTRPTAKDVPEHVIDQMALFVVRSLDEFYADPANEAAYQAWRAAKEAAKR